MLHQKLFSSYNQHMESVYSVGIIGAGAIGALWDSPDSPQVLTHAHAFSANPRTELIGLVDSDTARGKKEGDRWSTNFYNNTASLFKETRPDIVVIATPDETHASVLKEVILHNPKLIICEKPVATNEHDAALVHEIATTTTIPIEVNFLRRFDSAMIDLQKELSSGTYGTILSARATYGKGTHHIGSHIFDLVRFFFGEMQNANAQFVIDEYPNDPTYGGTATFDRCPQLYLQAIDSRIASIFELDIMTQKARIRITDEGNTLRIQQIVDDPTFKGFKILGEETVQPTQLGDAMKHLAEHAVAVLGGKESVRVTLADALKTYETCAQFASSYNK